MPTRASASNGHATVSLPYPEKRDTVTFKITTTTQTQQPRNAHEYVIHTVVLPIREALWLGRRIGNKVPHPFLLFIYLIIVLMVTTAILSAFGVSAKNPTDGTPVVVKNLLSVEGLHWFLPNVIKNFSGFAPLGAILALVLGAGLAERVGLLPALMVKMASHVNARYASYMVLFIAFSATFLPMRR